MPRPISNCLKTWKKQPGDINAEKLTPHLQGVYGYGDHKRQFMRTWKPFLLQFVLGLALVASAPEPARGASDAEVILTPGPAPE